LTSVEALNRSLDRTLLQMSDTDPAVLLSMRQNFLNQVTTVQHTYRKLLFLPFQNPVVYNAFYYKLIVLLRELESGSMSRDGLLSIARIPLTENPFAPTNPAGNGAFTHSPRFPLKGAHATIGCAACHTDGVFAAGRSTACASCHESRRPANHAAGDCGDCHTVEGGWTGGSINHQTATDCQSCHENKRPANHFAGQCSLCHTAPGVTWTQVTFNHQGITECQSCHENKRPANHSAGDCSLCHTAPGVSWTQVTVNHQGLTECQSCHESKRPANHYAGDCSLCHTAPGVSWTQVTFNHQGRTDCQSCHENRRPFGHVQGQCSLCHSTSAWLPTTFVHTFPIYHNGANGQCTLCHPTAPPAYSCLACHDSAGGPGGEGGD
jgi:hypothetical protein